VQYIGCVVLYGCRGTKANRRRFILQHCHVLLLSLHTSNLHLANDGPCRLNVGHGKVLFLLWKEELIEDLQRWLAIHSLVNQGPEIAAAAAAASSSGSWSAHGRLSVVRYYTQEDENAEQKTLWSVEWNGMESTMLNLFCFEKFAFSNFLGREDPL
jgi:hypothetical protein